MLQDKSITLSDEGCLLFDFLNQMKDHEGIVCPSLLFIFILIDSS